MTVLGIDTASSAGSVALARQGEIVAAAGLLERGAHARDLLVQIDALLGRAGLRPADLNGVAVTTGPGSFTGVRIGLATAKGLAYSLGIGLAGLSTLEGLARAALLAGKAADATRLCAAIEAGRGEVYAALFKIVDGEPARETADLSYRPADLLRALPSKTRVVGDGSGALGSAAREAGHDIEVIDPCPTLAGAVALWGCKSLRPGTPYLPGGARPNYVRPSDAEAMKR
jgi:tRNA threonylcarbamoyladenosine biosynthesis protein TsaB